MQRVDNRITQLWRSAEESNFMKSPDKEAIIFRRLMRGNINLQQLDSRSEEVCLCEVMLYKFIIILTWSNCV